MGASFHFVCEELKKNFYCIAPDLRGFGKSEHTKNSLGYFFYEYVADVEKIFHHFSPKAKIRLVGHSMGGNVAGLYAGTNPSRVSHFINVEGFGIMDMPSKLGPKRMRQWLAAHEVIGKFKVYKSLRDLVGRLQQTNPNLSEDRASFFARCLSKKVKGGYQIAADPKHKWVQPYLYRTENVFAFWKEIDAHVINVVAENTEMASWLKTGKDVHKEIDRRIKLFPKGSKKKVVKDCGHMIHHEKPEELAEIIHKFLKRC